MFVTCDTAVPSVQFLSPQCLKIMGNNTRDMPFLLRSQAIATIPMPHCDPIHQWAPFRWGGTTKPPAFCY